MAKRTPPGPKVKRGPGGPKSSLAGRSGTNRPAKGRGSGKGHEKRMVN